VARHHHGRLRGIVVARHQEAAELRPRAQDGEERPRRADHECGLEAVPERDQSRRGRERGDPVRARLPCEVEVVRRREGERVAHRQGAEDRDEPVGFLRFYGAQHDAVGHADDRGGAADPDREAEDGAGEDRRRAAERPPGLADLAPESGERVRAAVGVAGIVHARVRGRRVQ
jgi:hypothetical protein